MRWQQGSNPLPGCPREMPNLGPTRFCLRDPTSLKTRWQGHLDRAKRQLRIGFPLAIH